MSLLWPRDLDQETLNDGTEHLDILEEKPLRPFRRALVAASGAQLAVLLATIVVVSLCSFGQPVYHENDDCFLAMVGSGFGVALHPEPHLVFSHFGYGLLLGALTHLFGVYAHGFVTIFSIWLSMALFIDAGFTSGNPKLSAAVLIVGLGCVFFAALLSAEFTITAGALFGTAIASALTRGSHARSRIPVRDLAVVLALVLSYLIRPESFQMGLIIVVPALLVLRFNRLNQNHRAGLLTILLVAITIFGIASEKLAYALSPAWRDIPEYNDLRSDFVDYHRVPWSAEAPEYAKVNWSYYDYAMFNQWYMRDPIFSGKNLSFLVSHLAVPFSATALSQIRDWFVLPFASLPLLLTLCAQVVIWGLLPKQTRLPGLLLLAGETMAISAAALTGREPLDYVWATAAAVTLMGLCALLISSRSEVLNSLGHCGLGIISVVGIIALGCVLVAHNDELRNAKDYRAWIARNREWLNGKVTVWSTGLRWEWLITPTRIYPPFPSLHMASIDDINCMPVETTMLQAMGIDDLAKDLCHNPETRLIAPVDLMGILPHFCAQHYGVLPVYREAARWNDLGIYVLDHEHSSTTASK